MKNVVAILLIFSFVTPAKALPIVTLPPPAKTIITPENLQWANAALRELLTESEPAVAAADEVVQETPPQVKILILPFVGVFLAGVATRLAWEGIKSQKPHLPSNWRQLLDPELIAIAGQKCTTGKLPCYIGSSLDEPFVPLGQLVLPPVTSTSATLRQGRLANDDPQTRRDVMDYGLLVSGGKIDPRSMSFDEWRLYGKPVIGPNSFDFNHSSRFKRSVDRELTGLFSPSTIADVLWTVDQIGVPKPFPNVPFVNQMRFVRASLLYQPNVGRVGSSLIFQTIMARNPGRTTPIQDLDDFTRTVVEPIREVYPNNQYDFLLFQKGSRGVFAQLTSETAPHRFAFEGLPVGLGSQIEEILYQTENFNGQMIHRFLRKWWRQGR